MEIPVLAGRDFNDFDTATSRQVVLVNETFATVLREQKPGRGPGSQRGGTGPSGDSL